MKINDKAHEAAFIIWLPLIIAFIIPVCVLEYLLYTRFFFNEFIEFYTKILRSSLFSAFITAGSFLFSVKTFAIFRLNDEVYNSTEYQAQHLEDKKLGERRSYLTPLKNFSNYLFSAILLSFTASIMQLTVGLIPSHWAVIFCISISVCTIFAIIASLVLLKQNLSIWFEIKSSKYNNLINADK